jgi:predicted DCC family thiol-disulfide oxidoreductase YuxK
MELDGDIDAASKKTHWEEAGFSEFVTAKGLCQRLLRAGDRGYIDACMALGDASGNATFEAQARSALGKKCREGWRLFSAGNLVRPVPHVDKCAEMFAGGRAAADDCKTRWMIAEFSNGANSEFIKHCLKFVGQTASGAPSSSAYESREQCRVGWKNSLAALAEACLTFIELAGRNPRASGIGAWVIDEVAFEEVARAYPMPCE